MKTKEIKDNCYLMYTWRVVQNNRFVGYVLSPSETGALIQAKVKFGSNLWVERATPSHT